MNILNTTKSLYFVGHSFMIIWWMECPWVKCHPT